MSRKEHKGVEKKTADRFGKQGEKERKKED